MRRSHLHPNGLRPRALRCEALEARHLLTTLVVENHLDGALADLAGDGELSLREAIEIANTGATIDGYTSTDVADTIVFDPAAFTGGGASLIRLTAGELLITESLTIDGSQAEDLVISGDALGNDPLVPGTFLTSLVSLSVAEPLIHDNSRVINFQADGGALATLHLTVTGGNGRDGGGILISGGTLRVEQSRFVGNYATDEGGAIASYGSGLILRDSSVNANLAIFSGGGVAAIGGFVLLERNEVSGNRAYFGDGGAVFSGSAELSIVDSILTDNAVLSYAGSGGAGGGIYAANTALFMERSTLSGNSAPETGGGIYYQGVAGLLVSYSTITANVTRGESRYDSVAAGLAMDVFIGFSTVLETARESWDADLVFEIANSVVSENYLIESDEATFSDLSGRINPEYPLALDYSLLGEVNFYDDESWTGEGNVFSTEPLLGPLADNGGPTRTHALLPGSPALDAGDPAYVGAAFDQRGEAYTRVVGGRVDMGAYEAQATPTRAPGDYNGNGLVDAADYTVWRDALGATGLAPLTGADGDGDGEVTHLDHGVWRTHYGFAYDPPSLPGATDAAYAAWGAEPERRPSRTTVREALAPAADAESHLDALLLTHIDHSPEERSERREEAYNEPNPMAKERTASASPVRKAIPRVGDPI